MSKQIIHEVLGVLAKQFSKAPEEPARAAVFLSELAELVVPRKKLAVLDDEPDNRILECAGRGHADIIVTGDRAMLDLKRYQEIRMLSLCQFLDEISAPDRSITRRGRLPQNSRRHLVRRYSSGSCARPMSVERHRG